MVEVMTIVAFGLTFGVPALILGFGAMIGESKASLLVAYTNFIVLMSYFLYLGHIPLWILVLVTIIITIIIVTMYKSVLGDFV